MSRKPKIVLYQSQQVNQDNGQFTSYDMLPLEMLHIAGFPVEEGYEVVILDASLYSNEEAHRRAVEACEGAMIFGTTAILGYMVADGHMAAMKVKEAHPNIRVIAGGWFPSVCPEAYLSTGLYDAVCMGQGELTFRDYIHAVESGADLEGVNGLALWRDGQVYNTDPRTIVGWNQLTRAPWQLIDIEPYKERQLRPGAREARNRMPCPPAFGGNKPYFGVSYYASFGCPEPCTFCCSPLVTNRRWKAMPANEMLDDIEDLKERWQFDVLRFQDANWGVHEKRVREFCQGMVDRKIDLQWSTTVEVHSINAYKPETLDLCAEAGMYLGCVGAESADPTTLERVGKPIKTEDMLPACKELHDRNIITSLTYIIGYPDEPAESMLRTIEQAREIIHHCPTVSAHVYPFRPIPGNEMYQLALDMGYKPPTNLLDWGNQLEYHVMDTWSGNIPDEVQKRWRLYYQYASFFHGLVRPKRGLIEKISEWRIKTGNYNLPLELKAFYVLDRIFGWGSKKEDEKQSWIMKSENESVAMAQ